MKDTNVIGQTHLKSECTYKARTIELALTNFYLKHGYYPFPAVDENNKSPIHSWRILILPFLGENELYKQYDFAEPWNGPSNSKLHDKMPSMFRCPSVEDSKSFPSYLLVINNSDDSENENDEKMAQLFLIETNNNSINWLEPKDFPAANFENGGFKGKTGGQKLCRLINHRSESAKKQVVHITAASINGNFYISEDSTPAALKALSQPNAKQKVSITYPWGEECGIQRIVLNDP